MKTSEFIMANRAAPGQGRTLGQVLAGSPTARVEPDAEVLPLEDQAEENALRCLSAGYRPGQLTQLDLQLADVTAELEAEREKLEKDARRQERAQRAHQAGQIRAWQIPEALSDDLGDEGKVALLERRQTSLQAQLAQARQAIVPQARPEDPLEAATRRAHQVFAEATRAMMDAAEAGRPAARPFGSAGRGVAVRGDVPDCEECAAAGATAAESAEIHRGEVNVYQDAAGGVIRRGTEGAILGLR